MTNPALTVCGSGPFPVTSAAHTPGCGPRHQRELAAMHMSYGYRRLTVVRIASLGERPALSIEHHAAHDGIP